MSLIANSLRWFLTRKPIAYLPVRVRSGIAEGAAWTFFPWTAYWRGTHEAEIQTRLIGLMDWTGKNIWDLGSHYGIFAVGLGRRAGPTGSVAAFEPNPLSYRRLVLHVQRNHLDWVKTFPLAVSNTQSLQRFFVYHGLETTSSHLAYEGETWNETIPTLNVESVCLDELVATGKIKAPDFIKLDVEGHGHKALEGARETITRARPIILAGLHSDAEIHGITELLLPLNYRMTPATQNAPKTPTAFFDYLFEPLPR